MQKRNAGRTAFPRPGGAVGLGVREGLGWKSGFLALVFPGVDADVRGEFPVLLQLVNHSQGLLRRLASRGTGGLDEPGGVGVAPASEAESFIPCQFTRHVES